MTTIETDLRPPVPEPPATPRSRDLRYLLAAAVLIVGVVAAVLLFGVQRPPALARVTAGQAPEPPASLAWNGWTGDGDCVHVVDPDGASRQLTCGREGAELVAWGDEGIVLLTWTGSGLRLETLDPDTGEVVATRTVRDTEATFERDLGLDDPTLTSRWRDGQLQVFDDTGDGTVLWTVDAPQTYRVEQGRSAPDGSVLAAVDSARRLLLFDVSGEHAPRVWHDGLPEWGRLVWEGTTLPELPSDQG